MSVALATAGVAAVFFIIGFLENPSLGVRFLSQAVIYALIAVVSIAIVRSGRVTAGSVFWIVCMWAIFAWAAWTTGGLGAAALGGQLLLVVLSGMLLGWQAGVVTAGAGVLVVAVTAYAQGRGLLPPPAFTSPLTRATAWGAYLVAVALLESIILRALERRRAESERLASVVSGMPSAVLGLDANWRYTFVNDEAVRLLGKSREELLGREVWEVFPAFRGTESEAKLRTAMDAREPLTFETRSIVRPGWIELRVYPTEEGIAVFYHDISDRKRAEEEREAAGQREAALKEMERSREELRGRAERMALLKEIAEVGASSLRLKDTADRMLDRLTDRLRPKIATILVIDDDRRHLVPLATRGFTAEYIEQHFGPVAVDGPGLSPAVFRSGEASYIADSETDPSMSEQSKAFNRSLGIRAGVSAPLVEHDEAIGTISFGWDAPLVMDADEIAFLESLVSEVAVGLRNARLFEAEHKSADYANALNRINDAIHSTLQIDEIMRAVVQDAKDTMGADSSVIEIREDESWPVRYAAGATGVVLGRPLTADQALLAKMVADQGEPVLVGDAAADDRYRTIAPKHGITAFAGVSLIVRGTTFGVLLLVDYGSIRHFGGLEKDFMGKLGASVSLALENARLFEAAAAARTNRVLAEVSELLASTLDVEAATSGALAKAGGLLGAVAAALTRVDDGGFIVTNAWGSLEDLAGRRMARDELPSHAEALGKRHPVIVGDVSRSSVTNRRLAEERAIRSFAIYPLVVHGDETGTLAFAFSEPRKSFDELETTTMARLAYTLSAGMQNAELYRAQEEAARDAQALNRINDAIHSTFDFDEIM